MPATALDHCTILTDDVDSTVAVYGDLLGLRAGARPPFGFPGAWLYVGDRAVLHVIGGRKPAELKAGVIDHVAFSAEDLAPTIAKLETRGLASDCRRLPGEGTWQLFFHDPNGVRVELDFAATEQR